VLVCLLSACAVKVPVPEGLANKGIIGLSSTDPNFGSNFFLSEQMERSSFLHNFLKGEGAPTAMEITSNMYGSVEMLLFYPKENKVYAAVPEGDEHVIQWIVRGPYPVARRDYRDLQQVQAASKGEPVFSIYGHQLRFPRFVETARGGKIGPIVLATPVPKATPKVIKRSSSAKSTPTPTPEPTPDFSALNTDQIAILMAQGYAERDTNGNIIHTVRSAGETLETIADWYTMAAANAGRISGASGLGPKDPLPVNTRVTIPMELVRRSKIMPANYEPSAHAAH
jgi:hypothetical protein